MESKQTMAGSRGKHGASAHVLAVLTMLVWCGTPHRTESACLSAFVGPAPHRPPWDSKISKALSCRRLCSPRLPLRASSIQEQWGIAWHGPSAMEARGNTPFRPHQPSHARSLRSRTALGISGLSWGLPPARGANKTSVHVVLPCLNEERCIRTSVETLLAFLAEQAPRWDSTITVSKTSPPQPRCATL